MNKDIVEAIIKLGYCEYGYGKCTAPDTNCLHWIGTYCELDEETSNG